MLTVNLAVSEAEGVVVARSLEFPGIIVQGRTLADAKREFSKSLEHLLEISARRESGQLAQNERVEKIVYR